MAKTQGERAAAYRERLATRGEPTTRIFDEAVRTAVCESVRRTEPVVEIATVVSRTKTTLAAWGYAPAACDEVFRRLLRPGVRVRRRRR